MEDFDYEYKGNVSIISSKAYGTTIINQSQIYCDIDYISIVNIYMVETGSYIALDTFIYLDGYYDTSSVYLSNANSYLYNCKLDYNTGSNLYNSGYSNNSYIITSNAAYGVIDENINLIVDDSVANLDKTRIWGETAASRIEKYLSNPTTQVAYHPTPSSNFTTDNTENKGTKNNPYLITSASDFMLFVNLMNSTTDTSYNQDTIYFKLNADIDLANYYVPSIVTFNANLDGNGYKISNFYSYKNSLYDYSSTNSNHAMILENNGNISRLFLENFKVINSYSTNDSTITAGFVAVNNGTISRISLSGVVVSCGDYTSGVVAQNYGTVDTIITTNVEGNDSLVAGYEYVSGIIAKAETNSKNNILGNESARVYGSQNVAGIIANSTTTNTISNIYNLSNVYAFDNDFTSVHAYAGLVVTTLGTTNIKNAYNYGNMYFYGGSTNVKAGMIAVNTAGESISIDQANYNLNGLNVSRYDGSAEYTESVVGQSYTQLAFTADKFPIGSWDFVNVWSVYSGTPVFKYFNDYIIQLPFGDDYKYIESSKIDDETLGFGATNKFFTYKYKGDGVTERRQDGKYVLAYNPSTSEGYIIEMNVDSYSITQKGIGSSTLTINNIAINSDGTVYVYKGTQATINITSVMYRHVTKVTLGNTNFSGEAGDYYNADINNDSVADYTLSSDSVYNEYSMTYDGDYSNNHNNIGNKTGVNFVLTPKVAVSDMYDRNRFSYFVTIEDSIDKYSISVSKTQNTSVANENLLNSITINELDASTSSAVQTAVTSTMSTDSTVATMTGVLHGSKVRIVADLNSTILGATDENVRIDSWRLKASTQNGLAEDRVVTNSIDTSYTPTTSLQSYFNLAEYSEITLVGGSNVQSYVTTNGKLYIEFIATQSTSGEYVIDLVKQWLVQVSWNLTDSVGENYPDVWLSGYDNAETLGTNRTFSQEVLANGYSTSQYNIQYQENSTNEFKTIDKGNYTINGVTTNFVNRGDSGLEYPYTYAPDSSINKIFVDNGQTINVFASNNTNYTFLGFKDSSNANYRNDVESNYTMNSQLSYHYVSSLEVTKAYYGTNGQDRFIAYFTPSIHTVEVTVNDGGDSDRGIPNGVVEAPHEVLGPSNINGTENGAYIQSLVKHGNDITINLLPSNKYILNTITIKYYDYVLDESTTKLYRVGTDDSFTYEENAVENTLPLMTTYRDGTIHKTTLVIDDYNYDVQYNSINTGDTNTGHNIVINDLYGNVEIFVDYTRYYWNDVPHTASIEDLGGDGSYTNPYIIDTASDWGIIVEKASENDYYAGDFFIVKTSRLDKTIDFSSRFTPSLSRFDGTIFGNGFTFNGVTLDSYNLLGSTTRKNYLGENKQGLSTQVTIDATINAFGLINHLSAGANINSINFTDLDVIVSSNSTTTNNSIVGLVAYNQGFISGITIDNTSSFEVSSNDMASSYVKNIGTIAGISTEMVSECINNATLTYKLDNTSISSEFLIISGLVGNNLGSVVNSINNGTISIDKNGKTPSNSTYYCVSGIAFNDNTSGVIYNVVNNGNISNTNSSISYSAGISVNNRGTLVNAYNTGEISNSTNSSGISTFNVGTIRNVFTTKHNVSADSTGKLENAYYLNTYSSSKGIGLSSENMKDSSKFVGFDFNADWKMGSNYPIFRFEKTIGYTTLGINNYSTSTSAVDTGLWIDKASVASVTLDSLKTTIGTKEVYVLDSAEDIAALSRMSTYANNSLTGKTFVIASETAIDMSGIDASGNGRYFTPINSANSNQNSFNIIGIRKAVGDITEKDLLEETMTENVIIKNIAMAQVAMPYSATGELEPQAFISMTNNCLIKGIDIENILITTPTDVSSIVGSATSTKIRNCNYISGNMVTFGNALATNYTSVAGIVSYLNDNSEVFGCSVTGYNKEGKLHETYEFGEDYGGTLTAFGQTYATGLVRYSANTAIIQENYFNGIINAYQLSTHMSSGLAVDIYGSLQNNYTKGAINVYNNSSVGLFVRAMYNGSKLINNYSANYVSNVSVSAVRLLDSSLTSSSQISKNYYLVDTESSPTSGVTGIDKVNTNSSSNYTTITDEMIAQIDSTSLKSQKYFKNLSGWDFADTWVYINNVNRDYPVLKSIYGYGISEVEVIIYNPHKYGDNTIQLGNIVLDDTNLIYTDADSGIVDCTFADIEDIGSDSSSANYKKDTTVLKFKYSVLMDEVGNFVISNTSSGLISSVLFGVQEIQGVEENGVTYSENKTYYQELSNHDNNDIVISQEMTRKNYGLIITFDEREYSITLDATLKAENGTDGVLDTDKLTIVLVHKSSADVVDYAYTVSLGNNEDYTISGMFNGLFDKTYTVGEGENAKTYTIDEYGTWYVYIYYPIFYINEGGEGKTLISTSNDSNNPTLVRLTEGATKYDFYDNLDTVINIDSVATNYLGSFTLDTITRDITISIEINKPLEYWLHGTASNN